MSIQTKDVSSCPRRQQHGASLSQNFSETNVLSDLVVTFKLGSSEIPMPNFKLWSK